MDWYYLYPLMILAGFCTGYINTLAGAGAAFALIALNAAGLPLPLANGTCRLGILFNTFTASYQFKKHGVFEPKLAWQLAIPTVLGAVCGSLIAVFISPGNLKAAIGVVMVLILATLLLKPKAWLQSKHSEHVEVDIFTVKYTGYFIIGCYAGFIQVGTH